MKHIYILLLMIPIAMFAQIGNGPICHSGPEFDFSGTPLALMYLVEDPIMPTDICHGVVAHYQRHEYVVPTLETADKYIGIYSNSVSGVTINAWSKADHSLLWQQAFNHTNTNLGRAYAISRARVVNDTLYANGHRSWGMIDELGNLPGAVYRGLISDRIIDVNSGEVLNDNFKGEDYHIYADGWAYNNVDYPQTIPGTTLYHSMSFSVPLADTVAIWGSQGYLDSETHQRYLNFPPFNEAPEGAAPFIGLKEFDANGNKIDNIWQYGPMQVTDSTKTYLLRYYYPDDPTNHLRIVEMDNWGHLIDHYDVTDQLSEDINVFAWNFKTVDRLNDNLYKIDGVIPNDDPDLWGRGEKRYIIMDGYGNLIRERRLLEIDGMKPLYWRSKMLSNGNLLHILRPVENNNIYLYEEYEDGSFRKAGELINHGDPFYAYNPKQIDQMSDGDIFIKCYVARDSIWMLGDSPQNFNKGGWGAVFKIEAEDLGLQVSTEDPARDMSDVIVYPNPATEDIRLDIDAYQYPIDVEVYDILGRSIYTDKLYYQSESIPVRSWSSGIYQIRVRSRDGVLSLGKIYKE